MIQNIDVRGVKVDVDEKLQAYVEKKLGRLDRFVSRHDRESLRAEVMLKEQVSKGKKQYLCEVVLHLPHDKVVIKESTINVFAAVDIAEAKLRNQLRKHKQLHGNPRMHRRLVAKLRRSKHDH
ncbi:ribosome-associated translation inhibitor RaiA [Candidatus Saccharibacteria bacterium]|nr:ribosome-associated translation inhibitor RaiA [Candidatus Saccharibacteria bacterium]